MLTEPALFPVGRDALAWILQGGKPSRGSVAMRWIYRWQRLWFDLNLRALNARCTPEEPLRPPVFVMGLWRSGTTFLHDLLNTNDTLVAPSTWQCMQSSIHALRRPNSNCSVRRPMDGFTITPDSPQEDEFAMLAQGIPSVYRAFFDPRRLGGLEHWLDPQAWQDLPAETWWPRWRRFLASVQRERHGRLLLKSPNHTFRIRAILRELPQSSFVWVLRDPREVYFSNTKMWKAMFQRYALWDVNAPILDRALNHFLVAAFEHSTQAAREACARLSPSQLVVLRFEDLVNSPTEVLEQIHDRLGIPWHRVNSDSLGHVISETRGLARTRYKDRPIPPDLEAALPSIQQAYAEIQETHGMCPQLTM